MIGLDHGTISKVSDPITTPKNFSKTDHTYLKILSIIESRLNRQIEKIEIMILNKI